MALSIIIVSYNVKYFLEQCLCSIKKAIDIWHESIDQPDSPKESFSNKVHQAEVIVIDNNSSDKTLQYLQYNFPFVKFIANKENVGFAKANNQGLQISHGEYILFLNPDTILPEDFFLKSTEIMNRNQSIGALGVQMIDGSGRLLKESKRGFPTIWASFCKLTGLTALFPKSHLFAKYYLGHLDMNRDHDVEALSGACMLLRKTVLNKIGGFDERFFMYAEDLDLSYRIRQSGFSNYYLSTVCIIHFKGESTIKDTKYIRLFYKAMVQFVQKHYGGNKGKALTKFLELAIGIRGALAAISLQFSRQNPGKKSGGISYSFEGDLYSIGEAKSLLHDADNKSLIQDTGRDHAIIFCEGKQLTFKEIINRIASSPGRNYRIHAYKSSSIVGSNSSTSNGEVFTLTSINE